jgi:hypothetical protein
MPPPYALVTKTTLSGSPPEGEIGGARSRGTDEVPAGAPMHAMACGRQGAGRRQVPGKSNRDGLPRPTINRRAEMLPPAEAGLRSAGRPFRSGDLSARFVLRPAGFSPG